MKTISECSREYGIPVSTINSAITAELIDREMGEGRRYINEQSEKFRSWIEARMQQSRVKRGAEQMQELAEYAVEHRIRIGRKAPDRYAILEPLHMLFSILESCPSELDFAQAASAGEIMSITGCKMEAALEYVARFYAIIGGNQADAYKVTSLLSKQVLLSSAYINFFRSASYWIHDQDRNESIGKET